MTPLGSTNTQTEMPQTFTTELASLPVYSSLSLATTAGVVSGQPFILSGVVLGLNTVNLLVVKP